MIYSLLLGIKRIPIGYLLYNINYQSAIFNNNYQRNYMGLLELND